MRRETVAGSFFVVGSINMDLVAQVTRFPQPGETVKGTSFLTTPGGKGANQACALARLGARVHMVGKMGNDQFAREYAAHFADEGITADYIGQAEDVSTGIAVIEVNTEGENHIVIVPGANEQVDPAHVDRVSGDFGPGDTVLLQLEVPLETVLHTLKKAKEKGAVTILDPAPAEPLPEEIYRTTDYLTPNATEISVLADMPTDTEEQLQRAVDAVLSYGAGTVIVKRGDRGATIFHGGDSRHVAGFPVSAADTTAAGDSFNAGLAYGLGSGLNLPEAVRYANAVGALSTLKMGAQTAMPTGDEVKRFLEDHPAENRG